MVIECSHFQRRFALAATIAVHVALLYWWNWAQQAPQRQADGARQAIQWLWLRPPPPAPAVLPHPKTSKDSKFRASRAQQPVTALPPDPAPDPLASPGPASAAPRSASAEALLSRAKRAVGDIAKDLRKESRGLIRAPADSPQIRMQKRIAEAADLAANKWYQAPKVSELIDPGGYGRRRYRVVTAGGTYCMTYDSNHSPSGLDTMNNGIKPKITDCPEHEQAATRQEW
jgi:hypothetical protein